MKKSEILEVARAQISVILNPYATMSAVVVAVEKLCALFPEDEVLQNELNVLKKTYRNCPH